MSGGTRDEVRADLLRYVKQRGESGLAYILDPGPGESAPVECAPDIAPGTAPEPEPAPAATTPQPARSPVKTARTAKEEAFRKMCDAFVRETVARVVENRKQVAASDLFTAGQVAEPPTLEERTAQLEALKAEVAGCEKCKLHPGRTKTVFGAGSSDAGIVFVGEAPGRNEDLQGDPFVGRAGQLLSKILEAIELTREEVFICNILKCRPPNNRDPEGDEIVACSPYLKRQIELLQPKVICCLGRHAAQTLLETKASLKNLREAVHFYEGVPVMATYHPAALLRNPHWKAPTWDDVRKLRALHDALAEADKAG